MGSVSSLSNSFTIRRNSGYVFQKLPKHIQTRSHLSLSLDSLSSAGKCELLFSYRSLRTVKTRTSPRGQLMRWTAPFLRTTLSVSAAMFSQANPAHNARWRQLTQLCPEATAGTTKSSVEKRKVVDESGSRKRGPANVEPLPEPLHAILPPEKIGNGRVIIVGDIHGCLDEFVHLLNKCERVSEDVVVLVGDLGNKGPKSAECVAMAREMGCYAVRGNHDDSALAVVRKKEVMKGMPALKHDRQGWVEQLSAEDVAYMRSMPFSLSIPSHGALVVHAGLVPGVPLRHQHAYHLYTMRYCRQASSPTPPTPAGTAPQDANSPHPHTHPSPDPTATAHEGEEVSSGESDVEEGGVGAGGVGELVGEGGVGAGLGRKKRRLKWEVCGEAGEGAALWGSVWKKQPHVFFGHDAARNLQLYPRATGLDTGCCYGRELTACILPRIRDLKPGKWHNANEPLGGRLVSVKAHKVYEEPKIND